MDITKYFRVVSVTDYVLHIEMQGFWSSRVVEQIGDEVQSQFCGAVDSMQGAKFIVLADLSEFGVLGPEVKAHLTKSMVYANEHGLYKSVEILPRVLSEMGVDQAAEKSEKGDFRIVAKSLAEAQEIVNKLKQEL